MLIFLYRECFETPLPDMATAILGSVMPSHLGGHESLHPATETAIKLGQKDQVEVVGHDAIRENLHRLTRTSLPNQIDKPLEGSLAGEDTGADVATIHHMVRRTRYGPGAGATGDL
jgi:hypothetical protein